MKCQILGEEETFYMTGICPLVDLGIEISVDMRHPEGRGARLFREGFSRGDLGEKASAIVF